MGAGWVLLGAGGWTGDLQIFPRPELRCWGAFSIPAQGCRPGSSCYFTGQPSHKTMWPQAGQELISAEKGESGGAERKPGGITLEDGVFLPGGSTRPLERAREGRASERVRYLPTPSWAPCPSRGAAASG